MQLVLMKAAKSGGAGASAMALSVCTLMWIRTTINYQYRYGTSMTVAFRTLYKEGGIPRFYRGLGPALLQAPLSRFGDTASNTGTLVLLDSMDATKELPIAVKTGAASVAAGLFRICLMPVDTFKTTMQVEGKEGIKKLMAKFKVNGPSAFFQGALASAAATTVGHYPWFATYNYLNSVWPRPKDDGTTATFFKKLGHSATIGFASSFTSDCVSNSVRVVKVYKQANTEAITYPEAVKRIIAEDGVIGLFGRGLSTKIVANGLQGVMFSIVWKFLEEKYFK